MTEERNDAGGGNEKDNRLPRLMSALELLTEEELIELNRRIVQRLRLMQDIHAHGKMANFRLGQRVRFTNNSGETVSGTLTRYNRKSVTIVTDAGVQWRVSPALLQPE
jgi:hypothetical protein